MTPGGAERGRIALLLGPAYLWLTVAVFLPLSAMLYFSFLDGNPFDGTADWSLENYAAFFQTGTYASLMWKSLVLGATVTGVCLLIGFPCAWVLAKVIRGRSREALFLLVILPFWSNSLVRIFSWAIVLRGNGMLDHAIDWLVPGDIRLSIMFSFPAIVIGLVHSYLPYVILTAYLALQAIDDSLIEAARSLGARRRTILRRLILPLALPGLIAGAVLVFVP
jgi:spermidine/putrescine transport system permease protein